MRVGWASAPSCASIHARCIHPRQVQPIHAALRPSADALDWARRVLIADAASPGAARLDGRMVDRPVVLQAQRTLALARD
jgi:citrate lyase subunit beta / citryl-CoA lyase